MPPMTTMKKLVVTGSAAVLGLYGLFVVSAPFLREPPEPVVHVSVEPPVDETTREPLPETTETTSGPVQETTDETTSGAYRTGERTGEELNHLWQETKDFGRGLWSSFTEKEN